MTSRKGRTTINQAGPTFGVQASDNMNIKVPIAHQKTTQWKGWMPYDATKWAERQNGESSAKKWKAKESDEEPSFDSTKPHHEAARPGR